MRTLAVRVTPRGGSNAVMGWMSEARDELSLRVAAPPEGGKANEALIRLVASSLGIAKSQVRLVRGQGSRHKLLEVLTDDTSFDSWAARLPVL